MTPSERTVWASLQRRAGTQSAEVASALVRAFRVIAQSYSEQTLARLIATGQIERVIEAAFNEQVLNAAYAPVRDRIRSGVTDGLRYYSRDLPLRSATVNFAFDTLAPNVITAIRELELKHMTALTTETQEVVRAYVENGLRDGVNPRTIARDLRGHIGLAPNQLKAVENFEKALREGKVGKALGYELRDKRLKVSEGMTDAQIEKAVSAYRKRMIAHHAETISRTAALDAQKAARRLSWEQAVEQGIVDGDRLRKRWVGVKDEKERESHLAMEGDVAPYDQPYSNGQMVPGEGEFNCRCVSVFFVARAA